LPKGSVVFVDNASGVTLRRELAAGEPGRVPESVARMTNV
jgi:hypothetical protein